MRHTGQWFRVCLVAAGILFVSCGVSFAQQGGGKKPSSPPSASDMVSKMKEELGLSDEQASQITPIIEEEISQMKELMGSVTDRESARDKMDALHQDTESRLSQYLTADQLAEWKSKQKQPPQRGDGNMPSSPSGGEEMDGGIQPPVDMGQE